MPSADTLSNADSASLTDSGFASSGSDNLPTKQETGGPLGLKTKGQRAECQSKFSRPSMHAHHAHHPSISSLLRTTLLLATSSTSSTSNTPSSSIPTSPTTVSRRTSISSFKSRGSSRPSSIHSLPSSIRLHSSSTTALSSDASPSLAQFSPTPRATSCLASFAPRSRSPYRAPTDRARSSSRHRVNNGLVTAPSSYRRRWTDAADAFHEEEDSSFISSRRPWMWKRDPPSISRTYAPDVVDQDTGAGSSTQGWLTVTIDADDRCCQDAEDGSKCIFGTPRPSYDFGYDRTQNASLADSPVHESMSEHYETLGRDMKGKGKGKERPNIPGDFVSYPSASASPSSPSSPASFTLTPALVTPSIQSHSIVSDGSSSNNQGTLQRALPLSSSSNANAAGDTASRRLPITKSSSLRVNGNAPVLPTPPTLQAVERGSRLMRSRVQCANCGVVGVDFPRCPRCQEGWCSRECRVARMVEVDVGPDGKGKKKHICSI